MWWLLIVTEGPSGKGDALDHVRIKRPLRKEVCAADFFSLGLEQVDKCTADELAFLLRVSDPREPFEKGLFRIHCDERYIVMVAEKRDDLLGFVKTHEAVVNVNTCELITDSFVNQDRSYCRVHSA